MVRMKEFEVRDALAAEFFLHQVRSTVSECHDLDELRDLVVQLIDLVQRQKIMFSQMLGQGLDLEL